MEFWYFSGVDQISIFWLTHDECSKVARPVTAVTVTPPVHDSLRIISDSVVATALERTNAYAHGTASGSWTSYDAVHSVLAMACAAGRLAYSWTRRHE